MGGMTGVGTPELAAKMTEAGGLGRLPFAVAVRVPLVVVDACKRPRGLLL